MHTFKTIVRHLSLPTIPVFLSGAIRKSNIQGLGRVCTWSCNYTLKFYTGISADILRRNWTDIVMVGASKTTCHIHGGLKKEYGVVVASQIVQSSLENLRMRNSH
ncbi:hypothetical protein SUGI_0018460 [Cryptomeria japonica]|nr:hypothetical protein SUGI_0018460 [Cryptomeria japonica]